MEQLQKLFARLPILPVAIMYCGWLAYDYHDWMTSPTSDLGAKKGQVASLKQDLEQSKKKLSTGEEFFKNLDSIRDRIRSLTAQLDATKASLSADIDIANFVRIITLEVKKLGLQIKAIKPEEEKKSEYYIEVPFEVSFKGAYVQLLVFFDRVAKFQQVIRIGDFNLRPSGNNMTKYVELSGSVKLIAYKYLGSAADEVLNKDSMKGKEREQWGK